MNIKLAKTGSLVVGLPSAIAITLLFGGMPATSHDPTPQPSTTPTPSSMTSYTVVWKGLIEQFAVTTAGAPLPPQSASAVLPGKRISDLGREHFPVGTPITYNSNPPTSGAHYPYPAGWGIYKNPPADEFLVHNLEHGGVIISYNPNRIKGQELQQLRAQTRSLSKINPRIILTPRSNLDKAITLTAWTYLQKLDRYDPAAVKAFYNAHIARGPECEEGLCPG